MAIPWKTKVFYALVFVVGLASLGGFALYIGLYPDLLLVKNATPPPAADGGKGKVRNFYLQCEITRDFFLWNHPWCVAGADFTEWNHPWCEFFVWQEPCFSRPEATKGFYVSSQSATKGSFFISSPCLCFAYSQAVSFAYLLQAEDEGGKGAVAPPPPQKQNTTKVKHFSELYLSIGECFL